MRIALLETKVDEIKSCDCSGHVDIKNLEKRLDSLIDSSISIIEQKYDDESSEVEQYGDQFK